MVLGTRLQSLDGGHKVRFEVFLPDPASASVRPIHAVVDGGATWYCNGTVLIVLLRCVAVRHPFVVCALVSVHMIGDFVAIPPRLEVFEFDLL